MGPVFKFENENSIFRSEWPCARSTGYIDKYIKLKKSNLIHDGLAQDNSQYITALYFFVPWMLDDQCRGPNIKEKDHLDG